MTRWLKNIFYTKSRCRKPSSFTLQPINCGSKMKIITNFFFFLTKLILSFPKIVCCVCINKTKLPRARARLKKTRRTRRINEKKVESIPCVLYMSNAYNAAKELTRKLMMMVSILRRRRSTGAYYKETFFLYAARARVDRLRRIYDK